MRVFFSSFGFFSLFFQIILLREISHIFSSHEIAISAALSFWIFWTAAGTVKFARTKKARQMINSDPFLVFAVFSFSFPLWIGVVGMAGKIIPYGIIPDFFTMLLMSLLLTSVPGILNGMAIYELINLKEIDFYIWETAGALASGIFSIAYLYFFPGITPAAISILISLPFAAVSFHYLRKTMKGTLFSAALLIAALTLFFSGGRKDFFQTPYVKLRAEKKGKTTYIYENTHFLAQYPDDQFEESLISVPLLLHRNPRKIFFTSADGLLYLRQVRKFKGISADISDKDKWKYEWLRKTLGIKENDGFSFISSDARTYLSRGRQKYDVIFVTNGNPENAANNRFYTLDFMLEAKKSLKKGGMLVFQIPSSENYLSPNLAYFSASVLKTAEKAFSHMRYVPGKRMTILASDSRINLKVSVLKKNYRKRKIRNKIYVPWNMALLLGRFRTEWFNIRLKKVKNPEINTDSYPISYFYLWKIWLSMTVSNKIMLGMVFSVLFFLALLARTLRNAGFFLRNPLVFYSFIAGFWAIVFEITILLLYQAATGNLAWKMGFLFASFMAGGALSSAIFKKSQHYRKAPHILFAAAALITLTLRFSSRIFHIPYEFIPFCAAVLFLAAAGGIVGGYYACASRADRKNAYRIYALDLWGSALGGFAAAAFLIPFLGTDRTLSSIFFLTAAFILPVYITAKAKSGHKRRF